jgi:hypothetical protein
MAESIDITLSATDNATAVIQKSVGQMELLRDQVEQVSKNSTQGAEAVSKMANAFGAGWVTDAATQMKDLAESAKKATEAMKTGGSASLALKAGLAGLAAFATYKIHETVRGWTEAIHDFTHGVKAAGEEAAKANAKIMGEKDLDFRNKLADIKEFGGSFDQQREQADALAVEIEADIQKQRLELKKKTDAEWLQGWRRTMGVITQTEEDNAIQAAKDASERLRALEQQKATLLEMFSDEEAQREKRRDQLENAKQGDELKAKQEQEAIKAREDAEKQALYNRKKLTEAFFKFQEDMAKQYAKEEEKQQKAKEKATLKQKDLEIKAASEAIKATQKEISDLEKVKIDTNTSLQGREERVLSRSTDAGGLESQQLANSKKQTMILEKQRELEEKIERHLKLMAEKEDKVVEFSGA